MRFWRKKYNKMLVNGAFRISAAAYPSKKFAKKHLSYDMSTAQK
jgi:hypothetical protein